MRASAIHEGDVVLVNIKGWEFTARVTGTRDGRVQFEPLGSLGYHSATPRQIVRRLKRPPRRLSAQGILAGLEGRGRQ